MFGINSFIDLAKTLLRLWYVWVIILLCIFVWWYWSSRNSLQAQKEQMEAEILKHKYLISELNGMIAGKDKEISFQKEQMELLKQLKEKERVIENNYHERVVENNTTIQQLEENKDDWTPVLDQIDSYFGFKPAPK